MIVVFSGGEEMGDGSGFCQSEFIEDGNLQLLVQTSNKKVAGFCKPATQTKNLSMMNNQLLGDSFIVGFQVDEIHTCRPR